jgi:hypothetical protein
VAYSRTRAPPEIAEASKWERRDPTVSRFDFHKKRLALLGENNLSGARIGRQLPPESRNFKRVIGNLLQPLLGLLMSGDQVVTQLVHLGGPCSPFGDAAHISDN